MGTIEAVQSLSGTFAAITPAIVITLAACFAWLSFCRWFYRKEEAAWKVMLGSQSSDLAGNLEDKFATVAAHLVIARRGSPADRLFFAGLTAASIMTIAVLIGRQIITG